MRTALAGALSLGLAACVGPTLEVAQHLHEEADAGKLDAGPSRTLDAGDARVVSERDAHLDERIPCLSDFDCQDNQVRRWCSGSRFVCVECTADRHCPTDQRCDDVYQFCRPIDHSHDSDPSIPSPSVSTP